MYSIGLSHYSCIFWFLNHFTYIELINIYDDDVCFLFFSIFSSLLRVHTILLITVRRVILLFVMTNLAKMKINLMSHISKDQNF